MTQQEAFRALDVLRNNLSKELGERLVALYLYGSLAEGYFQAGQSDVNLLAVVAEGTSMHDVRAAYRPVWQQHHQLFKCGLAVATPSSLKRHLTLFPNLGHQLATKGKLAIGRNVIDAIPTFDPYVALANDCLEAMTVSALLAPALLEDEIAEERMATLRSLTRRLTRAPIDPAASARSLFILVHEALAKRVAQLPDLTWQSDVIADAPSILPTLRAIYERADELLLVFPELAHDSVEVVDWDEVAELVAADFSGLLMTTGTQLRLIAKYATPMAIAMRHFSHAWGHEPLSDVEVDMPSVLLAAAQLPSSLLIERLPVSLTPATEEGFHKLIHDIQNKLLNIQLQHELLHRIFQVPKAGPEEPLPGRETEAALRINAIIEHLDWWTAHYVAATLSVEQ